MSRILYTTHFGSRLFGTSTPASDTDIKHIELPDIQGLLVGRKIENRVQKTNTVLHTRNGADDVDVEFIPLQRLARDFWEGQTYALEIVFSAEGDHAAQTHFGEDGRVLGQGEASLFREFLGELQTQFLSSNISAMMGYVVNQANIYSFKGERLNVARAALSLMAKADPGLAVHQAMEDGAFAAQARGIAEQFPKYFEISTYDTGGPGAGPNMAPCFKLLEKTIPWSVRCSHAHGVVLASVKKYGQRANAASVDNVDWKATMHAVRIVDEGVALLADHRLTMPHPPERAARLLSIRRGEVPIEEIRQELDSKLDVLKSLSNATALPAVTPEMNEKFDGWLQEWMMRFYGLALSPGAAPRAARTRP